MESLVSRFGIEDNIFRDLLQAGVRELLRTPFYLKVRAIHTNLGVVTNPRGAIIDNVQSPAVEIKVSRRFYFCHSPTAINVVEKIILSIVIPVNRYDPIAVHHIKPIGIISGTSVHDCLLLLMPFLDKQRSDRDRNS